MSEDAGQMENYDTDVFIVGAGPTGLMLACQLLRFGISFRIIDKQPDRAHESRALVIHAKSMELFKNLGLVDEVLKAGRASIGLELFVNQRPRASVDFGDIGAEDTPFPYAFFLAQSETERIMHEHLEKNHVHVERQVMLNSFSQDEHGVSITTQNLTTNENHQLRAKMIVGCDGAHSLVRHALGLEFPGAPYEQGFLLADAHVDWPLQKDRLHIFLTDRSLLAHFPLTPEIDRLIISLPLKSNTQTENPTVEEIETLASEISGTQVKLSNPVWLANFRLHHRAVKQFRVGNAFLAGDAAHIHSPAGGQGMNTGLQDAANLGWKIGFVFNGHAPRALLQTYQDERPPIAQVLLRSTDRIFRAAATKNIFFAKLRNILLPIIIKIIMLSRPLRKRAFRFVSQLAIRYKANPFIVDEVTHADEMFLNGPAAGNRAPDAPTFGSTLFDRIVGGEFHVLAFCASAREVESAREKLASIQNKRPWLKFHVFTKKDDGQILFSRFGVNKSAIYVIRPDGYIGFRSFGSSLLSLKNYLARFNPDRQSS